ncbi:PAS domain S-box protein [Ammoniphilus sp. YIM 78166]|uniref:PAS domain S-box protein n=1 Tax=Ammoniphilus sp. YIM 78166 TaxID=1644106 RepID=UPI00106FCE6A|nr:PAS domain S-box protein [Ammoniphilus sp. YIM 78166]
MFSESHLEDQHLFVRVFEQAPIGMIIGSPNGEFSKVNSSFCNMMGYSKEELLSLSFQAITHPDDLELCQSAFRRLLHGEFESYQHEKRYIHRSGEILTAILSVSLVRDEVGKPSFFISQVVDITEQKMKEDELKRIEELHHLIAEHSQDMIIRFTSEGVLTYVSPAVRKLLGYEPEEMIGKNGYDYWHPEDRDNWLEQGSEESRKAIFRIRHKEGHYVWQESLAKKIRNDAGHIQHVIGVCRDVTERRNMELEIQQIQKRHESLLECTHVGVCAINMEGRFIEANPAYEGIIGYRLMELTQMNYKELLFPEQLPNAENKLSALLDSEYIDFETFMKHKSGKRVEIRTTMSPIIINGEKVGVSFIVTDITEQKQNEELIRRSEKLAVVGELAAGIAHEIRNPLTSLRGFVQLFRSEDTTHTKKLFYDVMLSEIDRINEIVSELLVLAKPSNETMALGSIPDKLNEVVKLLEGEANLRNVVIRNDFDDDLPLIQCQRSLKQVFINLLKNSIESMSTGGEIWIRSERQGEKICIQIIDQGCGIPSHQLSKIGQPFYTTKESGTGLGLMVSHRIIQHHRGMMRIESEVGRGTAVEIILPLSHSGACHSPIFVD